jgi:hypothetical protein
MTAHVFLGPSAPLERARTILPQAEYHPPAALGDVCALFLRLTRPRLIALIDGFFEQIPAVWHKEILYALSQGVHVLGGASMGALRAAELAPFGMIGIGSIFEGYRNGTFEDDDEVTVVHGPEGIGFRSLSEAMVNLRDGLSSAELRGILSAGSRRELERLAKAMHYPERSWPAVLRAGASAGLCGSELEALRRFVDEERPNLKQRDALQVLEQARVILEGPERAHEPSFVLEPTINWRMLWEETAARMERTNLR